MPASDRVDATIKAISTLRDGIRLLLLVDRLLTDEILEEDLLQAWESEGGWVPSES